MSRFDVMSSRMSRMSESISRDIESDFLRSAFGSPTKIGAIRNVRESRGCGLKEAKDIVEMAVSQSISREDREFLMNQVKYEVVTPTVSEEHPGFVDVTPRHRAPDGMPELPPAALAQLMGEQMPGRTAHELMTAVHRGCQVSKEELSGLSNADMNMLLDKMNFMGYVYNDLSMVFEPGK